ncbi:MAG: hypothetical protein AB1758_15875, partial [Candidatus Eremiobacterota bacterium]
MQLTPAQPTRPSGIPARQAQAPERQEPQRPEEDVSEIFRQMGADAANSRRLREQLMQQARADWERAEQEARLKSAMAQMSMSALWWAQFKPAAAPA